MMDATGMEQDIQYLKRRLASAERRAARYRRMLELMEQAQKGFKAARRKA